MYIVPDSISLKELQCSSNHLVLATLGGIIQSRVAQGSLLKEYLFTVNYLLNNLSFAGVIKQETSYYYIKKILTTVYFSTCKSKSKARTGS